MEDLPQLDIQEDIATLMESDEDEVADEPPLQDLSQPVPKKKASEIFVHKPSNKEPEPEEEKEPEPVPEISEKTGKPKRKLSKKQKEHLDKVRAKAIEACKQKKRDRLEVEARVKAELKERKKKERVKKEKPKTPPPETSPAPAPRHPEEEFGNFMAHMERFEKMRHEYNLAQQKLKPKPTINPPKPQQKPQPPTPAINIISQPTNPYTSAFNW